MKNLKCIRAAISVEKDTKENIDESIKILFTELEKRNRWKSRDILSVQFTITNDLKSRNPAASLRSISNNYSNCALFCSQEPVIEKSPELMIRVMIFYNDFFFKSPKPAYLKKASALRPDIK